MRPLLALVLLLASTSARAQDPVDDEAPESVAEAPAPDAKKGANGAEGSLGRSVGDGGRLGIALLGGGAALAASTAAATSLIEAISRDDRNANAPPKNPELVQVSGFVTVSLMSVSVGVMLLGGALLANDLAD